MVDLLHDAANRSARYIAESAGRRVAPSPEAIAALDALGGGLPEKSSDPGEILAILDQIGSPATVTTSGGRYFGFVIGGALPAALAANWLAGAWDQNAAFSVMSPVAARLEEVVLGWVLELLFALWVLAAMVRAGVAFLFATAFAVFRLDFVLAMWLSVCRDSIMCCH